MKKYSCVSRFHIVFMLFFVSSYLYAQDILWEKTYERKATDYMIFAEPTAGAGFILGFQKNSNQFLESSFSLVYNSVTMKTRKEVGDDG